MRIFKKGNEVVGVYDKFIYLMSVYKCAPRSSILLQERYLVCKNPIKITKELLSTKTKNSTEWKERAFDLCFGPEKYLRNHGYCEL